MAVHRSIVDGFFLLVGTGCILLAAVAYARHSRLLDTSMLL
jgi:hypothetical protein